MLKASSNSYYELVDLPQDSISSMTFHPVEPDILLVTSWDESAYIYQVSSNRCVGKMPFQSPILCGIFNPIDSNSAFIADIEGNVHQVFQSQKKSQVLWKHQEGVQSLCFLRQQILVSGSWDASLRIYDQRTKENPIKSSLPGPVHSMDCNADNLLVVGMNERQIHLYDIRKPQQPLQKRESSLKYATRSIKCFSQGYICASVEGRVAVEYYENNLGQRYAFKCHRQECGSQEEMAHSVNAVAVHPGQTSAFATGGSDGNVFIWDYDQKKRIKHLSPPNISPGISSLAFSPDGGSLAIAASYCFEKGPLDNMSSVRVIIKRLNETDIAIKKI